MRECKGSCHGGWVQPTVARSRDDRGFNFAGLHDLTQDHRSSRLHFVAASLRRPSNSSSLELRVTSIREKGSGTKNAKHPPGRSGFWCLTPFRSLTLSLNADEALVVVFHDGRIGIAIGKVPRVPFLLSCCGFPGLQLFPIICNRLLGDLQPVDGTEDRQVSECLFEAEAGHRGGVQTTARVASVVTSAISAAKKPASLEMTLILLR